MGACHISQSEIEDKGGNGMKTSCKIIEDLLPLYIDDVCSKESREFVINLVT